jgi:addiction module HigA family antidote
MDRGPRFTVRTDRQAEHPGVLLRDHVLPALHLSVSQAARDLAVTRQTLHRILAGNAAISIEMAARLERFCGVSSEFWLDCQHRYDLQQAKTQLAFALSRVRTRILPEGVIKGIGGVHGG